VEDRRRFDLLEDRVTLDYRRGRGRELLLKLVRTANVLIENFVPGKLEQMNLGRLEPVFAQHGAKYGDLIPRIKAQK